ncbi:MAG: apolipoprotein N-acyltransferase [Gammaproteobacteria bacterium]
MLRRRTPASDARANAAPVRGPRGTVLPAVFAVLAGFASLFSFEPFGGWPLQFLSLAYLFYQVGMDTRVRRSALIGWAFGFGWSVAGMHWLYIAMNRFGGLPAVLAALAVCLLAAYMGLFAGLASASATWLRRKWSLPVPAFLLLVLPVTWGLSEWMRGWVFTGFPWAASGYAHNAAPLGGFAPIVGVYGLGVLVALCAGCLVMLTQRARLAALGLLAVTLGAGALLRTVEWTAPQGQPISVRLLQGNVAQGEKFSPEHLGRILTLYRDMITEAPADLIATPETAVPLFPVYLPAEYFTQLADYATASHSHILYGVPLGTPETGSNSVNGITPGGGPAYQYDKHHLVPFGEFVPLGFKWFVRMMNIPLGDFRRGDAVQAPFAVKDQLVLPNICYEDVFGEEIAAQLRNGARPATLLLNVSNLAWYGDSVAIPQHLQISQMRALETGRPMLRSTNTGATAIIDGRGKVLAQLPFNRKGTLAAQVQGMGGMTPYIRLGNLLFLALGALALTGAWFSGRRYARQRGADEKK